MSALTPSQTPAEFSNRLLSLEASARAASTDLEFLRVTEQAKAAGLSYLEALEAVIREASGGAD